jgi:hypothetical protein
LTNFPSEFLVSTPERFDANQVELVGLVTKLWARSTGDVFARISVGEIPEPGDDHLKDRSFDSRLTLLLPAGQVAGRDISLLKGDVLHIQGYLSDLTLWESLREFLLKARQSGLFERIPELAPAMGVQVKRMTTWKVSWPGCGCMGAIYLPAWQSMTSIPSLRASPAIMAAGAGFHIT